MEGGLWLAAEWPTIADIACFPYIALSQEGGISRDDFPAIRRWIDRVRHLNGFIGMPGIFAPHV
jgi:glutathione S-transferase